MTNCKGFTFIEALVAASLLMVVIATLIPMASLLMNEREGLQQKSIIINELHYDLQPFLKEKQHHLPHHMTKTVAGTEAEFRFTAENHLLKGCVTWNNANDRANEFCLYGYPEE